MSFELIDVHALHALRLQQLCLHALFYESSAKLSNISMQNGIILIVLM